MNSSYIDDSNHTSWTVSKLTSLDPQSLTPYQTESIELLVGIFFITILILIFKC